jgi:hypothetical protein
VTRRWRTGSSIAEGLRNVVSAPFLFGALTVAVALVAGGAGAADLVVTSRVLDTEQAYLDAGGDILVAQVTDGDAFGAAACTSAAGVPGVVAAAAVDERHVRIAGRPEVVQTVLAVTPGFAGVVDAALPGPGEVLVADTLAERWQWSPGGHLQMLPGDSVGDGWTPPTEVQTVAATVPLTRLGDAASTSLVTVRPETGDAGSCVLRVRPEQADDVAAAIPATLGEGPSRKVQVSRQVYTGQFGPDPAAEFAERPTQWAGLAGGAVIGVILALITWTRRQRAALYATLGVPPGAGVVLRWTESATPLLLGAGWATVWAATLGLALGLTPVHALLGAAGQVGAAVAVALAAVIVVGLWRPPTLAALKDR